MKNNLNNEALAKQAPLNDADNAKQIGVDGLLNQSSLNTPLNKKSFGTKTLVPKLTRANIPRPINQPVSDANDVAVVESIVVAENLRAQASSNHEQFEVNGRTAMLSLMSEVYAIFYNELSGNDKGEEFMRKVRNKLVLLSVQIRKSSSDSTNLVRFIFKHFDDKQVSVYARSLAVAFKKEIAPNDFTKFIQDTDGGFSGVQSLKSTSTKANSIQTKAEIALTKVRTEETLQTIELFSWSNDEEFQVLIATRNDDDSADIKNAQLSDDGCEAVILRYKKDKDERDKPKQESDETEKEVLRLLEEELSNEQVNLQNIDADIRNELAKDKNANVDRDRARLKVAQLRVKSYEKDIKSHQNSMAEAVPA